MECLGHHRGCWDAGSGGRWVGGRRALCESSVPCQATVQRGVSREVGWIAPGEADRIESLTDTKKQCRNGNRSARRLRSERGGRGRARGYLGPAAEGQGDTLTTPLCVEQGDTLTTPRCGDRL